MKFLNFFSFFFLCTLICSASEKQIEDGLISDIQTAWNKTKSYQSDFEQTVISKTLGTREESQGRFFVQKPLRLRWETSDGKTTQILSGKEFWQLKVSRRKHTQVDHYSDISRLTDLSALTFLSDKIDIKKSYNYRILTNSSSGVVLALTLKAGSRETILAEISKPSYLLGALKLESADSETRIQFKNVKTDVPLADSLFRYEPKPLDTVHHHTR